jgi:hypothetical protein
MKTILNCDGMAEKCRRFHEGEITNLTPGWGCCKCKCYNGLIREICKNCGHAPCYEGVSIDGIFSKVDENKARMFFANVFDTGLMALDLAKTTVYHGKPEAVAVKLRQFGFDVELLAAALENSGESFATAMNALGTFRR